MISREAQVLGKGFSSLNEHNFPGFLIKIQVTKQELKSDLLQHFKSICVISNVIINLKIYVAFILIKLPL